MGGLKRTALFEEHARLGAKLIPFGGWEMPVQYSAIIEEHLAVRNAVGLFDVSHMGDIFFTGETALDLLLRLFTNNMAKLKEHEMKYTFLLDEHGRILDDMIVYNLGGGTYFTIPNAATTPMVATWIRDQNTMGVTITDRSDELFCLALQGPKAGELLGTMGAKGHTTLRPFTFARIDLGLPEPTIVSRSGYTGEDGFELVGDSRHAVDLWRRLLAAGAPFGIRPIGLGARDTLRTEKGFLLSGQDFHRDRTPVEASAEFAVRYDHDFIGRAPLEALRAAGTHERFVGIKLEETGVPRTGYPIQKDGKQVGACTSGTMSPSLKVGIALGYVQPAAAAPGTAVTVLIRDRPVKASVVPLPFVPAKNTKPPGATA